ncbi:hypothetical protein ACLB2K_071186 [Fragaria x ananassa]
MTELANKYKTYRMLSLFRTIVYTEDPANVEYVFETNFANYSKGLYLHEILSDYMGDGIFAVDGDKWMHQRKASSSQFSTKVLRDFSSEIFKTNGLKLAGIIHQAANCSKSIDIQLKKSDFISRLIETRETDPKYLRDMVFNFIAAGKDTTTSALSWFMQASNLTKEALSKMQYLHAALNETLRLYPAVPMIARGCFSDDTWPDGHSVRKGELVIIQPYSMGRMKFIWGDDAEEFRPERWLDGNGYFKEESPFKFIAFNAGPRICLGRDYSYLQMKIFSAVLFSNYIFNLTHETKVVNYKTMITLEIDGGLHVHAFPRV